MPETVPRDAPITNTGIVADNDLAHPEIAQKSWSTSQ